MLPSLCAPQLDRTDLEASFGGQVQPIPPITPLRAIKEARKCTILQPYKDIEGIAPVPPQPSSSPLLQYLSVLSLALIEFLTLALKSANNCHFLVDSSLQSCLPTTLFLSSFFRYPLMPINL